MKAVPDKTVAQRGAAPGARKPGPRDGVARKIGDRVRY